MPFLKFSAYRLGLYLAAVALLYALGMREWLPWVVAVVLALLASYAFLSKPRAEAARYLQARKERRQAGHRFTEKQEADFLDEDASITRSARGSEDEPSTEEQRER